MSMTVIVRMSVSPTSDVPKRLSRGPADTLLWISGCLPRRRAALSGLTKLPHNKIDGTFDAVPKESVPEALLTGSDAQLCLHLCLGCGLLTYWGDM